MSTGMTNIYKAQRDFGAFVKVLSQGDPTPLGPPDVLLQGAQRKCSWQGSYLTGEWTGETLEVLSTRLAEHSCMGSQGVCYLCEGVPWVQPGLWDP